jgi:hypothetical protein
MPFKIAKSEEPIEVRPGVYARVETGSSAYQPLTLVKPYRGERLSGDTVAALREQMDTADTEAAAKKARQEFLAKAKANPFPAMLADGTRVGVRGRHASRDVVLITMPDGSSDSIAPWRILRVLTDEEMATLRAAQQAEAEANRAHSATKGKFRYEIEDEALAARDIEVHYDPATDGWVAEVDGMEFRGERPQEVKAKIEKYLVSLSHPWGISRDGTIVPSDEAATWAAFRTREEAERFLATKQAASEAHRVTRDLLHSYRFDLTALGVKGDAPEE